MQIPFPIEMDARRKMSFEQLEQFVADIEARREPDALMPSFLMVKDKNGDRTLSDDEKRIARQLRHIAAMATLYLMDPAHEEAPEALHGNSIWARRLKRSGTKDPGRALFVARHRVLGAT